MKYTFDNINTPRGERIIAEQGKDFDPMDLPARCGVCGNKMDVVRPGKWQCNNCDRNESVTDARTEYIKPIHDAPIVHQSEENLYMTGAKGLLQSRRFWVLLIDTIVSLALFFIGKYFAVALDDVKFLILALQPIAALVIAAYTVDDMHAASIANQLEMHQLTLNAK